MSNDEDAKSQQAGVPRILVIEANPGYRSVISHVVEIAGGRWDSVSEVEQGRKLLDGTKFDLVIIGVGAESRIEPEVLKEVRALAQAPLIILDETYSGALETFEAGAEQILPKPFVPDALIGAIKVELRGPSPSSLVPLATRIELGGLVFDAERRVVLRGKTDVSFTKREWEVLSFFLASPNQYFRAEENLAQTWGAGASAGQTPTYLHAMRQKLVAFEAWSKP